MLIKDFLLTHELHDSLLTKVTVNGNMLNLTIDFSYWMQDGYQESEPETGTIHLCFREISGYNGPIGEIDDFSILKADYINNTLTLLLLDDFNNKSLTLHFYSKTGSLDIKL